MADEDALDVAGRALLDLTIPEHKSGATTVRAYLVELLYKLWLEESDFDSKRPWRSSHWQYDLYEPMIRAGLVEGSFDESGNVRNLDKAAADDLVLSAIQQLGVSS